MDISLEVQEWCKWMMPPPPPIHPPSLPPSFPSPSHPSTPIKSQLRTLCIMQSITASPGTWDQSVLHHNSLTQTWELMIDAVFTTGSLLLLLLILKLLYSGEHHL